MSPFLIYALPRSRTAWLSEFLTYRDWTCFHEQAVTMRSFTDVDRFFSKPNVGSVETGVSPGWQLIRYAFPDMREVVIHRPVDDVVQSFRDLDVSAVATYDFDKLHRNLTHMAKGLRKISAQPGVLSVEFEDLKSEETCKRIFEHCLPYEFNREWWAVLNDQNIQIDVPQHLLYCFKHRTEIERFKSECWRLMRALYRSGKLKREAAHA